MSREQLERTTQILIGTSVSSNNYYISFVLSYFSSINYGHCLFCCIVIIIIIIIIIKIY